MILRNVMVKRSRAKHYRTPAPVPRFSMSWFALDRSTWVFVLGVITLAYGTAAIQYSRWNHAENAHVHLVGHPWAIVVGIALIVLSYKMPKPGTRP
jgi:hypothetical protein